MPITWRPATWNDIELTLSILARHRGDALVGAKAAIESWKRLAGDPFFASAAIESNPAFLGHRLVGFGASVFVSPAFADAEIANPGPDINSRIIESIAAGQSVLATRNQVGHANAGEGVDVVVLYGTWRDGILGPGQKRDVQTLLAKSFTEWHAGYRIRRILVETTSEPQREFAESSGVYRTIAEFPGPGRVLHLMTHDSATTTPASLGSILFSYQEPLLRLRDSDRQLLLAAVNGATDLELAAELGVTLFAVKARWRSAVARVEEAMPGLVLEVDGHKGRGAQKRHRVLAYVRNHPEELRPFDRKRKPYE